MPSIYHYLNYREYLRDYFIEQKQFQRQVTHRFVLKKMAITSTGFLANVISGKKNLNGEMSRSLGRIINLAGRERRYLNNMVAYTQAKSIEAKKKYLDRLIALRKTDLAYMSDGQFSIFSRWYYVYIRDMLCFIDFKDDYQSLAHVPRGNYSILYMRKGRELQKTSCSKKRRETASLSWVREKICAAKGLGGKIVIGK
jgi:uncharacterized protein (TIGR02147 family)